MHEVLRLREAARYKQEAYELIEQHHDEVMDLTSKGSCAICGPIQTDNARA